MNHEEYFAELSAADALEEAVRTPEDADTLLDLRREAAQIRRDSRDIGHNDLVGMPGYPVVTTEEVQRAIDAGHEVRGPISGGAHSAN